MLSNMEKVIRLEGISKKYIITHERPVLLKNIFRPPKKETVWALKNINLTVRKGEVLGIIGENGSGKSTLLKILAGITTPTHGKVKVKGRVASLIELGAGFHPDLTGRENIYLNGALLGYSKAELDKKYQNIIDFADIGSFIDQPVRTYSSGMVVRLGFSVAIHLDPDILLIDEVLAVGDEQFQRKCFSHIDSLQKQNKTIIFVSHNLFLINSLCQRVVLLDNGKIKRRGKPKRVIDFYLRFSKKINKNGKKMDNKSDNQGKIIIDKINLINGQNKRATQFKVGESLTLAMEYENVYGPLETSFGFAIYKEDILIYGFSTEPIRINKGKGKIEFYIPKLPSIKGQLKVNFGIADMVKTIRYDSQELPEIINITDDKTTFYKGIIDLNCHYLHQQK